MKKKIIRINSFLILILVAIIILTICITRSWQLSERLGLFAIIIPIGLGVMRVISDLFFSDIPKFEVTPRVKTIPDSDSRGNPRVYKQFFIDVKNKVPCDTNGCKLSIKTKLSGSCTIDNLDFVPDEIKEIRLFIISDRTTVVIPENMSKNLVKLFMGQSHDLDLRFYGKGFINKKVHHLELDLTSFENCNLRIKTHWDWLKAKMQKLKRRGSEESIGSRKIV